MNKFRNFLNVFLFSGIIAFAVSCNEKRDDEPSVYTEVVETVLELPRKEGNGIEKLNVTFKGTFDEEGNWISKEVSKNVLDYFGLDSQLSFENFIENKVAEQQMAQALAARNANFPEVYMEATGGHSDCIEKCNDKYTDEDGNKIEGRGKCKFNCWVDTGIKILTVAATIAAALK
ncbi:hypothetical protein [Capnocytophaga felis]|uniref:Lipoprotein n=1 Tax=Capnocytophaga felis TaxID=2267611 RepID=A0A5M4B794_9FLAO|nr:hypothetical protein [Capnocytophaga felis]GET45473.1 hypothetical protein RCZ01_07750 [Capnocytophaga felis]GET47364.1 hypothetical protein RCZ02_01950 [Capnocytophaga felis]